MASTPWAELLNIAAPHYCRFEASCVEPEASQRRFLEAALRVNAASDIGRTCCFPTIDSPERFLDAVPLRGYCDLEEALGAYMAGHPTLSVEPVVLAERTSGSTRRAKMIPYTQAGLAGFHEAVFPWLFNLARAYPGIAQGRVYWSISPPLPFQGEGSTDATYLAPIAHLLSNLSAVPFALSVLSTVEEWRFWTAFFLATAEDLAFISIWSPTFLFPLLDAIAHHAAEFAAILCKDWTGTIPTPLQDRLPTDPRRAAALEAWAADGLNIKHLWPKLALISCWADGSSRRFLEELSRRCPAINIQPKGLLATEAAMSVPIATAPAPVLAINSAFFELHRRDGAVLLAHQFKEGDEGTLVVTTRSGLWRYRTGDRVRVTGFWRRAPCLEFLGREGVVSDLFGEKLDEELVTDHLHGTLDALLAPVLTPEGRYLLFLDAAQVDDVAASQHAAMLEAALGKIHHYALARGLGQLAAVAPVRVRQLVQAVISRVAARSHAPLGAIKPPLLDGDPGWLSYFSERELIAP